jgi:hypothetical protein
MMQVTRVCHGQQHHGHETKTPPGGGTVVTADLDAGRSDSYFTRALHGMVETAENHAPATNRFGPSQLCVSQ